MKRVMSADENGRAACSLKQRQLSLSRVRRKESWPALGPPVSRNEGRALVPCDAVVGGGDDGDSEADSEGVNVHCGESQSSTCEAEIGGKERVGEN